MNHQAVHRSVSHFIRPHFPALASGKMSSQDKLQHSLSGFSIQHRLTFAFQYSEQMLRTVDETVMPFKTLDRYRPSLAIPEQHQRRQIDGSCGAAVDHQDAFVSDYF